MNMFNWRNYAKTPQEFMEMLDKADWQPVRDPKRPGVVATITLRKVVKNAKGKSKSNEA